MKSTSKQPLRPCPCGSKRTLQACCGPLLAGSPATTAEALMRSRYTANVLKHHEHLLRTWHPSTRPSELDTPSSLRWTQLEIRTIHAGGSDDHNGIVEFIAHFRDRGRAGVLHETSRFVRDNGLWLYLDGDIHSPADTTLPEQ